MAFFKSILETKSRTIFLAFFALSSLVPLLIVIFIVNEYLPPIFAAEGSGLLENALTYGLAVMFLFPLLSFFIMYRWITSLERLTVNVRSKTKEVAEGSKEFADQTIDANAMSETPVIEKADYPGEENEIQIMIRSFNEIFQTAADQLAEQNHLKELLGNLIAVASDLTAELDFSRLFPMIISRITAVMSAERTSLYVIDWDARELWTKVAEGVDMIRLPLGSGISGRVAETGESINVADAWELPYHDRSFDQLNNFRTSSVLCIPVRSRTGQNIGVVQVINKKGHERFDHRDEVFLRGLASQVGIALENSLLIDELKISFNNSVSTLSAIVDAREPLTAGHSQRVTEYSLLIAKEMKLDGNEVDALRLAALLHDIGKIGIRDTILLKDGAFTPEEREEMNSHPVKTRMILDKFHFPKSVRSVPEIAFHHHEKIDGSGYPDHLTGDDLPLGSKIIAVADVFDALTSKREYPKYAGEVTMDREPMPLMKVLELLQREAGIHFEPEVVSAFLRCLPQALRLQRGVHFSPEYVDETIRHLGSGAPLCSL